MCLSHMKSPVFLSCSLPGLAAAPHQLSGRSRWRLVEVAMMGWRLCGWTDDDLFLKHIDVARNARGGAGIHASVSALRSDRKVFWM